MPAFERVLNIAEATEATRCVVCGGVAEGAIDLEMAASGAVIDAASSKLVGRSLRACRACEERQHQAKTYGKRAVLVAIFAMPVIALVAGLVADRDDVVGAGIGVVVAFVLLSIVDRVVARRRARTAALLLLGADDRSMLAQVNVPEGSGAETKKAAYREADDVKTPSDDDTLSKSPHPPRVSQGLYRAGGVFLTIVVCGLASVGALSPRRTLVIDSPTEAVTITIDDGEAMKVAAGGRFNLKIRSGKHRYRVDYVDPPASETGTFEVELMKDTLLTTDASQCYLVWVRSKRELVSHGQGSVRWTPLEDARSSDRCE